jgi:ubiquinone/menaquinone biosynthesis C-methylase UbiE
MTVTSTPARGEYWLGSSEPERARLIAQGEVYRPLAVDLLDQIGVAPGWRVADVGCGPLGVLDLLAERAGAANVVGLDRDEAMLAMAERSMAERGYPGVRLLRAEAAETGLPDASFDLVHERLLVVNVPNREQVVDELVRLTRPGGWVALQDGDVSTFACEPPHPAWDRLRSAVFAAWRSYGLDGEVGRRLGTLLRGAGLVDVQTTRTLHLFRSRDPAQRMLLAFAQRMRPRVLEANGLSDAELDALLGEVGAHLDDPAAIVTHFALYQAWGRRPD